MSRSYRSWNKPRFNPDVLQSHGTERCSKKTIYCTRKAVIGAKNTLMKHYGVSFNYYKCPFCREFHLTSDKVLVAKHDKNNL